MSNPPSWPLRGVNHPDGDDEGWVWYCPVNPDDGHAGETDLPGERTAIRYLIAHLGEHLARDAREYLVPARRRLMELVRADQAAGMRLVRGVVVDMIVLWAEVLPGDMVLLDDSLILVNRAEVIDKPWGDGGTFPAVEVTYQDGDGGRFASEQHGDRLTGVRRLT